MPERFPIMNDISVTGIPQLSNSRRDSGRPTLHGRRVVATAIPARPSTKSDREPPHSFGSLASVIDVRFTHGLPALFMAST
jgi:hypothetical protein